MLTGHGLARRHKKILFLARAHILIYSAVFRFSNTSQCNVEDAIGRLSGKVGPYLASQKFIWKSQPMLSQWDYRDICTSTCLLSQMMTMQTKLFVIILW